MDAAIRKSFFRVIDTAGQWVGSGFVMKFAGVDAQPVLVTCAHVVADALGNRALARSETAPSGKFWIDFLESSLTNALPAFTYENDPCAWFPMADTLGEQTSLSDVALIDIRMVQLPEGVEPIVLETTAPNIKGQTVSAMQGAIKGTQYKTNLPTVAEGIVQGQPGSFLQIRAVDPHDQAFVEGGCSGSPLWLADTEEVVGIVALADTRKNLAWIIPTAALREIYGDITDENAAPPNITNTTDIPDIPIDFRPKSRELLLKRHRLEKEVDERIDEVFLLYLHGEPNTGKSSEVQRLMESPTAKLTKDRTIWQTCISGLEFSEMADQIAEDCLGIEQGKRFGARELIRALKEKEMYLVLDGYSKQEHPTIAPLVEFASNIDKPTHLLVTTYDDPDTSDLKHCAVRIPRVDREDVIASIEALGTEVTLEYAQLVQDEHFDASSAYRIVNGIKAHVPSEIENADPVETLNTFGQDTWTAVELRVMSCLCLVETSISDTLYETLSTNLGLSN